MSTNKSRFDLVVLEIAGVIYIISCLDQICVDSREKLKQNDLFRLCGKSEDNFRTSHHPLCKLWNLSFVHVPVDTVRSHAH